MAMRKQFIVWGVALVALLTTGHFAFTAQKTGAFTFSGNDQEIEEVFGRIPGGGGYTAFQVIDNDYLRTATTTIDFGLGDTASEYMAFWFDQSASSTIMDWASITNDLEVGGDLLISPNNGVLNFSGGGTSRIQQNGITNMSFVGGAVTIIDNIFTSIETGIVHITPKPSDSNSIQSVLNVEPNITQSATAGYSVLQLNPTETSTGSGDKRLISAMLADVDKFWVDTGGNLYTVGDIDFDGEILPDGDLCDNTQILQKTGADDWDCVAMPSSGSGGEAEDQFWYAGTGGQMVYGSDTVDNGETVQEWILGSQATATAEVYFNVDANFASHSGQLSFGTEFWGADGNFTNASITNDITITNDLDVGGYASITGDISVGSTDLFVDDSSGYVGIGLSTPADKLSIVNAGSVDGINISQTGVLASNKFGLDIYSNSNMTNADSALLRVFMDSASSDQINALFHNDGTGDSIFVNHDNIGNAINIDADANSASDVYGLVVNSANAGAGDAYSALFQTGDVLISENASITGDISSDAEIYTPQLCLNGDCQSAWPAGGVPAGNDTEIQYNDAGSFGAEAAFLYDDATDLMTVVNASSTNLTVSDDATITNYLGVGKFPTRLIDTYEQTVLNTGTHYGNYFDFSFAPDGAAYDTDYEAFTVVADLDAGVTVDAPFGASGEDGFMRAGIFNAQLSPTTAGTDVNTVYALTTKAGFPSGSNASTTYAYGSHALLYGDSGSAGHIQEGYINFSELYIDGGSTMSASTVYNYYADASFNDDEDVDTMISYSNKDLVGNGYTDEQFGLALFGLNRLGDNSLPNERLEVLGNLNLESDNASSTLQFNGTPALTNDESGFLKFDTGTNFADGFYMYSDLKTGSGIDLYVGSDGSDDGQIKLLSDGADFTNRISLDGGTGNIDIAGSLFVDDGGTLYASNTEVDTASTTDLSVGGESWFTGTSDFTGLMTMANASGTNVSIATELYIPSGAAPVCDAAGNIAVDTTDDQLQYFGAAKRVIPYQNPKCAVIESLAAADDNKSLGMFADAVTITGVSCSYIGTGTTAATITLEDGSGNAMTITGTNPTCVAHGTNATFAAVTAGNTLVAGEIIRFDVTNAVAPETDEYTICYTYTTNAQ